MGQKASNERASPLHMRWLVVVFCFFLLQGLLLLSVTPTFAAADFLRSFQDNPRAAMNTVPKKTGAVPDPFFLAQKNDACRRHRSRIRLLESLKTSSFLSGLGQDDPALFLEASDFVTDIHRMDEIFRSGQVEVQPWSGDYWALQSGGIAKRYLDPEFPAYGPWQDALDYVTANPSATAKAEALSPAEKYDLFVDDNAFSITQYNWENSKRYKDESGDVEAWMGLCHGWAPASFMEPRPTHILETSSLSGKAKLRFYPDDIKALLTMKWANGVNLAADLKSRGSRFLGGRCNVKKPKTDPETGRIVDSACFNLNPGAWHIAITNQIAVEKRPLIIDAAYDYEVWNQPVVSYSYEYFNPKTMKDVESLKEAKVSLQDSEFKDKFAKFRKNPKLDALVGIRMNLTYVSESTASDAETDSAKKDNLVTVEYYYDLELDSEGTIVGGEWYQSAHPDFIWMPIRDSVAFDAADLFVTSDADAVRLAAKASRGGVVLQYVLHKLQRELGP